MTIRSRISASMPFAHLLGLSPRAAEGDEDEDKEKSKRARRAEEEGDDKDSKGKRAEEGDDEDKDLEGDDDKDDKDAKGRKAKGKRSEEDDDDGIEGDDDSEGEDEPKDAKSRKAVVANERVRCARIVAHGLKSGNVEQACVFAFDTSMSASAAISALSVAGAAGGRGGSLAERMKNAKVPNAGAGGGGDLPGNASPIAQQIIAAHTRAQAR